jgi:hypothetical protein
VGHYFLRHHEIVIVGELRSNSNMSGQHYVSKFHLRMFCDPSAVTPDPWLWAGYIATGSVNRRSPKNVGTVPDLFDSSGAFESPDVTIESFLANEEEGPAAHALREVCDLKPGRISTLPAPLMCYFALGSITGILACPSERSRWVGDAAARARSGINCAGLG